jgi:hypothetical protein
MLLDGVISRLVTDKKWFPLHPDIQTFRKPSHLNIYKALVRARNDLSVKYGDLEMRVLSDSVFAFTRCCPLFQLSSFKAFEVQRFPNEVTRNFITADF